MSSDGEPDLNATPEQFVRRAELLADLGRYDDAVAELGYAINLEPDNSKARTLLARVQLAAGRPAEALAALDTAPTPATAADLAALNARAMALIDLRRFREAADLAQEILRLGPEDPEWLCRGAALLSESRNGQSALDAAWRAVELAPDQAQTHLVLGVVAARLHQFQLSERAYRKALELNPGLAEVHFDIGVIHLEQRRYSQALASLAQAAAASPDGAGGQAKVRGVDPVAYGVRALLQFGAGYAILVPILVACASSGNNGLGRLQAVAMGIIGLGMLAVMATRLPGRPMSVLRPMMSADRNFALTVYAVAAGPLLVLLYALAGWPWLLVAAVVAGFAALLTNSLAGH